MTAQCKLIILIMHPINTIMCIEAIEIRPRRHVYVGYTLNSYFEEGRDSEFHFLESLKKSVAHSGMNRVGYHQLLQCLLDGVKFHANGGEC